MWIIKRKHIDILAQKQKIGFIENAENRLDHRWHMQPYVHTRLGESGGNPYTESVR